MKACLMKTDVLLFGSRQMWSNVVTWVILTVSFITMDRSGAAIFGKAGWMVQKEFLTSCQMQTFRSRSLAGVKWCSSIEVNGGTLIYTNWRSGPQRSIHQAFMMFPAYLSMTGHCSSKIKLCNFHLPNFMNRCQPRTFLGSPTLNS